MSNRTIRHEDYDYWCRWVEYHQYLYYMDDAPVISDYEYDMKITDLLRYERDRGLSYVSELVGPPPGCRRPEHPGILPSSRKK